ncbi:retrovirus-related pol polyprotein from transposon TNT 1-94 [Tanacetum coccineum]
MWNDLILAHEGPSDTRDTKIAALRLKFNALKSLEGEKVNKTFTRLKCLLNDLENNGVTIPQAEVNAMFVNILQRKWLSMNQTQKANNSIKNDNLATMTSNEFMADLNVEYHERALLENQKGFYKRSGRVGSARKPLDKSKETCFACGKLGYFQKDCPSHKTSTPSYLSSNNSFNKSKPYTPSFNQTSSQNSGNHQKDYKGKYKGLKAEKAVLTKRIDAMTKGKSEKGLIAESFDWDDEFVSSDDERSTKIRAFMPIAEEEPLVGKADARSGQWVDITMKKVHRLLSMTDGDERKHVLYYTYVDLHYVEDQRKNLVNKFNLLKQEISLHKSELSNLKNTMSVNCPLQNEVIRVNLENESLKDEIIDLKKVIEKWTCSKVTLDQLLSKQVPGNIVKALGGKGRRKEKIASKEVVFTKADESSSMLAPEITSNSESECDSLEPLPPLPKLIGVAPSVTLDSIISLSDLTLNMVDLTLDTPVLKKTRPSVKVSPSNVIKKKTKKSLVVPKPCSDKKADSFTEQLLLTLMEEPKCSTCGSTDHLTKEHLEHVVVKKTLSNLKARSPLKPSLKKDPKILKPFKECKYYGFNDHHSDHCEFYPGCKDYLKRSVWYLDRGFSRHMTGIKQYLHSYSKDSGPKVVFGYDSSGDTKRYSSVNCNGITFTRVAYMNGLKHKLISISQLCDANYKVLFTKTQETIYQDLGNRLPRLWPKRLFHLNFKNINSLAKHNLVSGLPSLTFSKDKNCSAYEKRKHHRASFKTKRSFSINMYTWVFCLKKKSDADDYIMSFIRKMENLNEVRVKELRSDNGTEFKNHKLEEFYDENGVFNNREHEMEETVHVTFSVDDEAISQSNTKGNVINFNENGSFPDDEFFKPRSELTQFLGNTEYFHYNPAYENTTPSESPILQVFVTSEDPPEFTEADNH